MRFWREIWLTHSLQMRPPRRASRFPEARTGRSSKRSCWSNSWSSWCRVSVGLYHRRVLNQLRWVLVNDAMSWNCWVVFEVRFGCTRQLVSITLQSQWSSVVPNLLWSVKSFRSCSRFTDTLFAGHFAVAVCIDDNQWLPVVIVEVWVTFYSTSLYDFNQWPVIVKGSEWRYVFSKLCSTSYGTSIAYTRTVLRAMWPVTSHSLSRSDVMSFPKVLLTVLWVCFSQRIISQDWQTAHNPNVVLTVL